MKFDWKPPFGQKKKEQQKDVPVAEQMPSNDGEKQETPTEEPPTDEPQEVVPMELYIKLQDDNQKLQENYQNLKLKSEQDALRIEELQKIIEELKSQEAPAEEPTLEPQPAVDVDAIISKVSDLIKNENGKLIELCNEAQKAREKAEDKYSTLFSQVQEDRYRKDKVKILSRSIHMREMIIDLLCNYQADKMEGCETPAAQFLQTQLNKLIDCLEADLKQEKVFKMENGKDGADFDEEHMEACGVESTDNPELSGKVCRSVAPGYYWTLPYILKPRITDNGDEIYSYKFIISYEQVITYKYTKE